MSGLSNAAETDFLNHNFRPGQPAYSAPAQHWISLHTADPVDTGAAEVTGGSYARFPVTTPATFWGAAASRQIISAAEATFTGMPAVTVTHCGIWDAVSAGNFMAGDALTTSKAIAAGETARFPATDLKIIFNTVGFTDYLAHAWLNLMFRLVAYTRPSSLDLNIYDGDPTGAGTPVAGSTPQAITFNAPATSGTRQQVTNNGALSFTNLTGGDNLTHWAVRDQIPNILAFRDQTNQTITAGDDVNYADTVIEVGID